jgi:hypothetical protein
MLFENINQYEKAKNALLENNRDINKTAIDLKKSPLFKNTSDGEIISQLAELNEGLSDSITNFISKNFGGDISKLKTVLAQMKEQELKFNQEEYEIYNKFYSLLQDQKALDRDKNNPDYENLSKEIQQSRNSLNTRMKELTKTHNNIFNALEEKTKSLVKDSNRKKKYFNAQRASDVVETQNDRYNKIKDLTAKSSSRSEELENFFGVKVEDIKKDTDKAKERARSEEQKLSRDELRNSGEGVIFRFQNEPEKRLGTRFTELTKEARTNPNIEKDLQDFHDEISSEITKVRSLEKTEANKNSLDNLLKIYDELKIFDKELRKGQ